MVLSFKVYWFENWRDEAVPKRHHIQVDFISPPRVRPVKVECSYTRSCMQRSQLYPGHHLTVSQNLLAFLPLVPKEQSLCADFTSSHLSASFQHVWPTILLMLSASVLRQGIKVLPVWGHEREVRTGFSVEHSSSVPYAPNPQLPWFRITRD